MVYITRKTPTNYRNRHSDWYSGVFRDVIHQIGLIGEALFWLDCEGKCSFVDSLIPDYFPLNIVQSTFISVFKAHYNSKYAEVYDDWCLQGCKTFETLEGQIGNVLGEIKGQVDEAKAYINEHLINPLRAKINEILPTVNDAVNRVRNVEAKIRDAQVNITEALSDVANLDRIVNSLNGQVKTFRSNLNATASDLNNKMNRIDGRIRDATNIVDGHTGDIRDLWDRVNQLAGTSKEQVEKTDWLKKTLEALI